MEGLHDAYPDWTQQVSSKDSWIRLRSATPRVAEYRAHIAENRVRIEVYIKDTTKGVFNYLRTQEQQIEEDIGEKLKWEPLGDSKGARITLPSTKEARDEDQWSEAQQWFVDALGRMRNTFDRRLKNYGATLD